MNEIIHSNLITLAGPLLATAQNYLLHSSLPLCSLLLTNCEGSHSVRLLMSTAEERAYRIAWTPFIKNNYFVLGPRDPYVLRWFILSFFQDETSETVRVHICIRFCRARFYYLEFVSMDARIEGRKHHKRGYSDI